MYNIIMNACESLRAMCQTDTEKLPPLPMDKHNTIQVGGGMVGI